VDPNTTLAIMRDELGETPERRLMAALDLSTWIRRGGFRPDDVTDDELDDTIVEMSTTLHTIAGAFS
jgi:hypothetical protein